MAMPSTDQPASHSAQVVGNAFVEQYYHILHQSPELVHKFYQDMSMLSRPDPNCVITSVTTKDDINAKICSLDNKNYKADIKTVDAQDSFEGGVIVLVTGCLNGKDKLRRNFTQTFFLAPQENGYFVLNDILRFVEENEPDSTLDTVNRVHEAQTSCLIPETEPADELDPVTKETAYHSEMVPNGGEKTPELVDNDGQVVKWKDIIVEGEPQMHENPKIAVAEPAAPESGPKKSYASIVGSVTKKASKKVVVDAKRTEKMVVVTVAQAVSPEAPAPGLPVPVDSKAPEESDIQDEVEGHSIHVRNLPINATVAQLEAEFKRFGPIKQRGVQVRSNKQQGFCFGFVAFQDISSMHSAIEASPVSIGDHRAVVEKKRTTSRVDSSRGRIFPGRGGYRNNNFKFRDNFSGGQGYARNDFGGQGDFSRQEWVQGGRGGCGGDNYQQERGRGGRLGG